MRMRVNFILKLLRHEERYAHRALLGGPVSKSLAITLVDIHCVVTEAGTPCIVVDGTHYLCLYLHGPA